jgi:thiol-disulfide isomerase/thioredoxin
MIMKKTNSALLPCLCLGICVLIGIVLSCSRKETAKYPKPVYYSGEALARAGDLVTEGYALLDSNNVEGAVAKFAAAGKQIPNGMEQEYHTACAYARSGHADEAFKWLDRLLDNGFDSALGLQYEPDFESIREDPRFGELMERANLNYEKNSAVFAQGLPDPPQPAETFASEEELKTWSDQQINLIRKNQRYWTEAQTLAARINYSVERLAALKTLEKDKPDFDYGLERVRVAANLKSIFEPGWGSITDLVLKEVDAYVKKSSNQTGIDEANYQAGMALSLEYADDAARQAEAYRRADEYLAKIDESSDLYGAAQVMTIVNKLEINKDNSDELKAELKNILDVHPDDEMIYQVVSTRLGQEAAGIIWPIPLDVDDIDGRPVALAEYKGKVLLIDFWATWCGPCRVELPGLVKAYNDLHAKGFEIVSISLDYAGRTTTEQLLDWTKQNGMIWRHVYSGDGWDSDLVKRFFVGSIPAPFLVGRDGELIAWGEDCRGGKLEATVERALGSVGR